jgi:hypothetical protein
LLLAALVGACSGAGHRASAAKRRIASPPARATVTSATRLRRSAVVMIENVPNGEGEHGAGLSAKHLPSGFRAALGRLPAVLPRPTGPQTCDLGRSVRITLSSGQKLWFGPCTIPPPVEAAVDASIEVYKPGAALRANAIEHAIRACRTGAPVGTLFSAEFSTVGEIRNPRPRSGVLQIASAFPGSPDTAFAAWCGRQLRDGHEQRYAVGPNGAIAIARRL